MTMKAIRTEKATLISTTSGMPLAPVAARIRPFSSDMKPTIWLTALLRVTIIKKAEQDHRQGEGEILARQRVGVRGHAQHDDHGQGDQRHAGQHGRPDADHVFDLAMDAEADDDPVQRYRNDDRLEDERDRGGDVKMRRVLDIGLPGHRKSEDDGLQGEHVEKAKRRS